MGHFTFGVGGVELHQSSWKCLVGWLLVTWQGQERESLQHLPDELMYGSMTKSHAHLYFFSICCHLSLLKNVYLFERHIENQQPPMHWIGSLPKCNGWDEADPIQQLATQPRSLLLAAGTHCHLLLPGAHVQEAVVKSQSRGQDCDGLRGDVGIWLNYQAERYPSLILSHPNMWLFPSWC